MAIKSFIVRSFFDEKNRFVKIWLSSYFKERFLNETGLEITMDGYLKIGEYILSREDSPSIRKEKILNSSHFLNKKETLWLLFWVVFAPIFGEERYELNKEIPYLILSKDNQDKTTFTTFTFLMFSEQKWNIFSTPGPSLLPFLEQYKEKEILILFLKK